MIVSSVLLFAFALVFVARLALSVKRPGLARQPVQKVARGAQRFGVLLLVAIGLIVVMTAGLMILSLKDAR